MRRVKRVRVWHTTPDGGWISRYLCPRTAATGVPGFLGAVVVYDEEWEPGRYRLDRFTGSDWFVFRDGAWQNADGPREDDDYAFEGTLLPDHAWQHVCAEIEDDRWGIGG